VITDQTKPWAAPSLPYGEAAADHVDVALEEERRPAGLADQVRALTGRFGRLWRQTPEAEPGAGQLGLPFGRLRRWRNRHRVERLVRTVCREVVRAPEKDAARRTWERRLEGTICDFTEGVLGWPAAYRESPLGEGFSRATGEFVRRARGLRDLPGGDLDEEDLFQALRNVWIMNGLQALLGRPMVTTPSVFAYSMLYPLTDNFLDDPAVSTAAKVRFNRRLGRRLAGERLAALDLHQELVFGRVAEIEGEFPRCQWPRVYEALLAIHRGQVQSLRQHGGPRGGEGDGIREDDLLLISAEKGGASVLADAYLVAGELTPGEAEFAFGYGVVLQLLDDLQDATTDRVAGHRTLFSVAAGRVALDRRTSRLARFTEQVLRGADRFVGPCPAPAGEAVAETSSTEALMVDLIRRNCPLLLVQSVGAQRDLFSRAFVRRLERFSPVSFRSVPALRRRAERRWKRTERTLERLRADGRRSGAPFDLAF